MRRLAVMALLVPLALTACGQDPEAGGSASGAESPETTTPTPAPAGESGIYSGDLLDGDARWHSDPELPGWRVEETDGETTTRYTHEETGCILAYVQQIRSDDHLIGGDDPAGDVLEFASPVLDNASETTPVPVEPLVFVTDTGETAFTFVTEAHDLRIGPREQRLVMAAAWIGEARLVTSALCDLSAVEEHPDVVAEHRTSTTIIAGQAP